ncbi:alpha/beta hydrolase [Halobacillus sp. K22]|uniref:alpha/beta hydrolase n=1 Tax=Halobacillus sp. K22 TaxID=3457431 RepID=UPI003FCD321A
MLKILSINSKCLNDLRTVRVYTPDDYGEKEKSYPVVYMHDGQNIFHDQEAIGGVSLNLEHFLNRNKHEVIVVGIDSKPGEQRKVEYCPWENGQYSRDMMKDESRIGGGGKQYIEFVVEELKPYIDQNYHTQPDKSAMAGISLGGLISTYAMCKYPTLFKRAAAISSAFFRNQEEMEQLAYSADLSSAERFYVDCGTLEAGSDEETINQGFIESNQRMYDIVKYKVEPSEFKIIDGGEHNYSHFRRRVQEFFPFLIEGWEEN